MASFSVRMEHLQLIGGCSKPRARPMPKVDIYGAQLFVMTRTAHLEHDHIAYVETAIFVRTNFIISARHGRIAIFARNSRAPVHTR